MTYTITANQTTKLTFKVVINETDTIYFMSMSAINAYLMNNLNLEYADITAIINEFCISGKAVIKRVS
jgi:hypothetical protein